MKQIYTVMKNDTLPFAELVLSIQAMRKQANYFIGIGKPYNKLLQIVLAKNFYDEEKTHHFSSKELQRLSGLTQKLIKKQLEEIYHDIFERALDDPELFTFQNVFYEFYVQGLTNAISFKGKLPISPSIGDSIVLPFLRVLNRGIGHFYVYQIEHQCTDTNQIIYIWLKTGFYNSYAKFKEDKDEYMAKNE